MTYLYAIPAFVTGLFCLAAGYWLGRYELREYRRTVEEYLRENRSVYDNSETET